MTLHRPVPPLTNCSFSNFHFCKKFHGNVLFHWRYSFKKCRNTLSLKQIIIISPHTLRINEKEPIEPWWWSRAGKDRLRVQSKNVVHRHMYTYSYIFSISHTSILLPFRKDNGIKCGSRGRYNVLVFEAFSFPLSKIVFRLNPFRCTKCYLISYYLKGGQWTT
jgi:hypothetical protein